MKWRALILGSGGAIGEFQVGAIAHLASKYDQFNFYAGSGVGSMNCSILAQYESLQEGSDKLTAIWNSLKGTQDLFDQPFLGPGLGALDAMISKKKGGIYGNKNLKKLIEKNVSWEKLKNKNNWVVEFTSLNDGQIYRATNHEELFNKDVNHKRRYGISFDLTDHQYMGNILADMITAAGCVPFVIEPKAMAGDRFVEGGIRNVIPFDIAIKAFEIAKTKGFTEAEFLILNNYTHEVMTIETPQVDGAMEILLRTLTNIMPI
jgi:predicted acylesterase/phospholipase RssA